jgi:hypothetical protein
MAGRDPSPGETSPPAGAVERRAWVRYGSGLEATCHAKRRKEVGWWGRVVNLSAGGVGLLVRHRFRPGTLLTVELKTCTGRLLRVVPVRVLHATAITDGNSSGWLLGCAFAVALPEEALQALLRADGE